MTSLTFHFQTEVNIFPDFIPDDTGVGVPLPPEDDDVVSNAIDFDEKPEKDKPVEIFVEKPIKKIPESLFDSERSFDEDDFIRQMENFHFIRFSDIVSRSPNFNPFFSSDEPVPKTTPTVTATAKPRVPIRTTPATSFTYSFQSEPVASPLVAQKPRQVLQRQTTPATTTSTSTTTPATTTTASTTVTTTPKSRSTTTATATPLPSSVKSLSRTVLKELTPRAPKTFPRFPAYGPQNYRVVTAAAPPAQLDLAPKIQVGNSSMWNKN